MSNYALEGEKEFERLEKQSTHDAYDFEKELVGFNPNPKGVILDAGCGSGIVTRHLSKKYPHAKIVGCDGSDIRVEQAKKAAKGFSNTDFHVQALQELSYKDETFDAIVCRYVVEHLPPGMPEKVFAEFHRCLKPGGVLYVIDVDGCIYNIFPTTPHMDEVFAKLQRERPMDLKVGRKLPHYFMGAKFTSVTWKNEIMDFQGPNLKTEIELIKERFSVARPFFNNFLGSNEATEMFFKQYLDCLSKKNATLFYNKFLASGQKNKT